MDYEISRKLWDARIPVEIAYESDELYEVPKPFFAMLQRCSYFVFVIPKAALVFCAQNEAIKIDTESVWLEYNGQPLKTYIPIGVLFDLMKENDDLPWRITLRTQQKPDDVLTVGVNKLQIMYMQTIKEADYLKRKVFWKGEMINCMKSDDHKQLWSALTQNNFDMFWNVNRKLMECSDSQPFLYLPLRLHERGKSFKQNLIQPTTAGHATTLSEALQILDSTLDQTKCTIISHGISIPLETPVLWMARNFAYLDNFVHLCLIRL